MVVLFLASIFLKKRNYEWIGRAKENNFRSLNNLGFQRMVTRMRTRKLSQITVRPDDVRVLRLLVRNAQWTDVGI